MIEELHIRPMERDSDGWIEVCLIRQPVDEHGGKLEANADGYAEGTMVGYIREVEGTEEGLVQWWDAKVIDEGGGQVHERRFPNLPGALLAMALRPYFGTDTKRLVGW